MIAGAGSLSITGLSKTFPGQRALQGVSLEMRSGEVHCLLGQNGSGKSTLIKVLAGFHPPDPGATASFDGQTATFDHADADWRRRVRFIHQDLGLVGTVSVMDNLALGRGFQTSRVGLIRWRSERERTTRLLHEFGLEIDVSRSIETLTPAERTMVTIARALQNWDDESFGVLVLDEPTASLAVSEITRLFDTIRRVVARGKAVLFVSHRPEEVLDIGDRVTVLRDGRVVASQAVAGLDHDRLVELIVGRPVEDLYTAPPPPSNDVVLSVAGLVGRSVNDVSLEVRAGEIVGIAGLVGSGREDLASLIFGASRRIHGDVVVGGIRLDAGAPRRLIKAGVGFVPADRATAGIIPAFAIRENLVLPALGRLRRRGRRRWWLARRAEGVACADIVKKLDVRPPQVERKVETLSGGNQQKVVLAKWLWTRPRILLLDEPTQGVDVGAKAELYRVVADAAADGLGVLVCSSDVQELANICDRVLVIRRGAIAAELVGADLTEERIAAETLRNPRRASPILEGEPL